MACFSTKYEKYTKKKAWESKLHIFFIIIIIFFGWMRCALYQFVEKNEYSAGDTLLFSHILLLI